MTRLARPQHVIARGEAIAKLVEAVQEPKDEWHKKRAAKKRQREHHIHPKLVRGLDEPGIPETVGSRLLHRLFPRRKPRILLQRSVADSSE